MKSSLTPSIYQRLPAALFWISICLVGIWFTSRLGYARLLARYASLSGNAAVAAKAVAASPLDAQVHKVRSNVFYSSGFAAEAAEELEVAVSLRPHDDYLWLQLGVIRDELHHPNALPAFNEAVRLAPYYGHPKWQRGNYLLRSGKYDEAFADLRIAAASNQSLVPSLIDLAWGVSRQNAQLTERWAGIGDDRMRIAFARFLASQGKAHEALEQFHISRVVSLSARRELMTDLIAAKAFKEAFEIWRGMDGANDPMTAIHDGDFESAKGFDDSGFGWRFAQGTQGARISLDTNQPLSGNHCLKVTFLGYSDSNVALLSQLLLIEPQRRYRVKFSVRTENLMTGGLPLLSVYDAVGKKELLGQSATIGFEGSAWQTMKFDFKTGAGIEAVELRLHRQQCSNGPCPIFGSLWLDDFAIEELK